MGGPLSWEVEVTRSEYMYIHKIIVKVENTRHWIWWDSNIRVGLNFGSQNLKSEANFKSFVV